jgi:hypothetical protein
MVHRYPDDIFTEPDFDDDTLANLGPLRGLAGTWEGAAGIDEHPSEDGAEQDAYVERYEAEPIDPQPNGPQVLYGLRYHTRIVKPGEVETFHDQVGYWLYEPATEAITLSIAIPRGQVALATGSASPDATSFRVAAAHGSLVSGIISIPFLEEHFTTTSFSMDVTIHDDSSWSYAQDTVLQISGRHEPFHHTDVHRLARVADPLPNPILRAQG